MELEEILARVGADFLPESAGEWAGSARVTAQEILQTIDDMKANQVPAPTPAQRRALDNIHAAALRWLAS
jgi:hypothetical protein